MYHESLSLEISKQRKHDVEQKNVLTFAWDAYPQIP